MMQFFHKNGSVTTTMNHFSATIHWDECVCVVPKLHFLNEWLNDQMWPKKSLLHCFFASPSHRCGRDHVGHTRTCSVVSKLCVFTWNAPNAFFQWMAHVRAKTTIVLAVNISMTTSLTMAKKKRIMTKNDCTNWRQISWQANAHDNRLNQPTMMWIQWQSTFACFVAAATSGASVVTVRTVKNDCLLARNSNNKNCMSAHFASHFHTSVHFCMLMCARWSRSALPLFVAPFTWLFWSLDSNKQKMLINVQISRAASRGPRHASKATKVDAHTMQKKLSEKKNEKMQMHWWRQK